MLSGYTLRLTMKSNAEIVSVQTRSALMDQLEECDLMNIGGRTLPKLTQYGQYAEQDRDQSVNAHAHPPGAGFAMRGNPSGVAPARLQQEVHMIWFLELTVKNLSRSLLFF